MEPHSHHRELEDQVRECFGRVVYSHKTHEKCADILLSRLSWIKISQIILSAITTAGFISVIAGDSKEGAIVGVCVSVLLLCLNAYTKSIDLGQVAQKHRSTASDLWLVREKYFSLLTDIRSGHSSKDDAVKSRDELLQELHEAYHSAPSTISSAFKRAQQALQINEELTFSSDEIDAFLPASLRLGDRR